MFNELRDELEEKLLILMISSNDIDGFYISQKHVNRLASFAITRLKQDSGYISEIMECIHEYMEDKSNYNLKYSIDCVLDDFKDNLEDYLIEIVPDVKKQILEIKDRVKEIINT